MIPMLASIPQAIDQIFLENAADRAGHLLSSRAVIHGFVSQKE
jgi:hypothetical protein